MRSVQTLAAVGASLVSMAAGQTSTSCNPTEKTCPSDAGLTASSYTVDFREGASSDWSMTYQNATYDATNGAAFTITASGDAPTMQSDFYVFFGEVTVRMKTSAGTGIVSTAILESDDLDEVDWEFLGGTATNVQTNYFGKGNTTTYDREQDAAIADSQSDFHNYTLIWTEASCTWLVDGVSVRVLNYADALDGQNYPQTPMRVKLGIWAGGDSTEPEGTIEWAGGETDYSQGPFTAYIQSVSIVNYNPAESYTYGDLTGSYESIEINGASNSSASSASSASTTTATTGSAASASKTGAIFVSGTASAAGSSPTGYTGTTGSNSTVTGSTSSSSSTSSIVTAGAASWGPSAVLASGALGALTLVSMLL
ncbi:concanavalin A-like lectin/glucanase domain-containing protein [Coniella lustricola]|uniref:Crh-like protein n=1 Tax=Coniella lustricola TaxID=2025994 RepID=A0A2T3A5E0_9PEZI|nr:concanavalin A-like lectin/glucanase domain-containing protein [Coniella lustricola]